MLRGVKRDFMDVIERQFIYPSKSTTTRDWRVALRAMNPISLFFTYDKSPDNHSVIDIQRRACWIAVALMLQALDEASYQIPGVWYEAHLPFIVHWRGTISFALILGSFIMMILAFRSSTLRQQTRRIGQHPRRWQAVVLVLVLITSLVGVVEFGRAVYMGFFEPPQYTNDGTSLDTYAAMLMLQGRNPYADSNIVPIAQLFALEPSWTTPLREGQFANRTAYPSDVDLRTIFDSDMKSGHAPEFEAKVSYPSLSFLTLVPLIWLGSYNVLPLYLLCYLGLIALGWSAVRKDLRPWLIVFALANISMWSSVLGGNLDVMTILFLVMAWLWREHRWRSALALGLALACKQPAWFYVPFYAILIFRTYNLKEAASRLTIAGAVLLVFNLPFILWDAHAWFAGVMAPVSDPMFPMGVGIVGLVGSPYLHAYMSSMAYSVLEYGIFYPLCFIWYWRICKTHPEAVMLLAVLPLFFAWRSLPSYFACAAFPMFILFAARGKPGQRSPRTSTSTLSGPDQIEREEELALA